MLCGAVREHTHRGNKQFTPNDDNEWEKVKSFNASYGNEGNANRSDKYFISKGI